MKKRICLILSLILLLPAILLCYGISLPSYYSNSYYGELSEMYSKLQKTKGPKIVIVGNSNVAFGLDSASLEESLKEHGYDYTVCNFGLYAAVGTSAMLSLSENYINKGDLVILAIEPTNDAFSSYFGATAMLKCAEDHPELLMQLNAKQRASVVGNYIEYLQARTEIRRSGILPTTNDVYAKSSFNENGDMIYDRAGNAMTLGYDTASMINLSQLTIEAELTDQINDYIAAARKNGAEVVISFSPMNRAAMTDTSEVVLYDFFLKMLDTFDCSVISNPNNYVLDSGWFYDSNFHLNNAGMEVRTHQLLLDLLTWFGCSDRVAFEMPQMPASIADVADNTEVENTETEGNAADFLYEEVGENGVMITGLTEEGLATASLSIPSHIEGKAVVAIAEAALASNHTLTELTLPATIESIPDGLFVNCPNMTSLTLLHRDSIPTVGNNLLEGTNGLKIYVTEEAYSKYRDGAGCAANTWEQYEDLLVPQT